MLTHFNFHVGVKLYPYIAQLPNVAIIHIFRFRFGQKFEKK